MAHKCHTIEELLKRQLFYWTSGRRDFNAPGDNLCVSESKVGYGQVGLTRNDSTDD